MRSKKVAVAGAGIGGLALALSLHDAGCRNVALYEAAAHIDALGVGVNLPPHAVRELTELGLGAELAANGIETAELAYYDVNGERIWAEPRGLAAGYRWPQYSIGRGALQRLMLEAVQDRLGAQCIVTSSRVAGVQEEADGARLRMANGSLAPSADVVIAADGIRSSVREHVLQRQVALSTNDWTMYRGTSQGESFLGGRTMVIVGDETRRAVVYPIAPGIVNWLVVQPSPAASGELGNWNRTASPETVAEVVRGWHFDWLDIPALVRRSSQSLEYPMADIDPLERWTRGPVVLLGDAAHAMYPFGSNGASQAILDARVLTRFLALEPDTGHALAAYEVERREKVGRIQLANRSQASEVMQRVSQMARARQHAEAARELERIESQYKSLAGFDVQALNARDSLSVKPGA